MTAVSGGGGQVPDEREEFYETVSTRATPADIESLEIGEAVYVEGPCNRFVAIVTEKQKRVKDGAEVTDLTFRNANADDWPHTAAPTLTILTKNNQSDARYT